MNKYTFFIVMAVLSCGMSFYYEGTMKEAGYITMTSFWILMAVVVQVGDALDRLERLTTEIKEKLDNEQ